MAEIGLAAVRLSLDFFRGDLPTFAGLSPQQLVAVGVLVALGVHGVRNAGQRRPPRRRRYGVDVKLSEVMPRAG